MSKTNKIFLIVVALIIVVGGFMLISNNSSTQEQINQEPQSTVQPTVMEEESTSEEAMSENETVTVALSNTNFSPREITVKAGTKVVWVNQSGKVATVDSAIHPTHQVYPKLNLGEFANGEALELVFDEIGTYSYHNHLDASQNGKVIVE